MPWKVKPYSRNRQEGGVEIIWNISEQIQGSTVHYGTKAKKCQRHCFNMCCVEQHTEDTTGPTNDVIALHNIIYGYCASKVDVFVTSPEVLF